MLTRLELDVPGFAGEARAQGIRRSLFASIRRVTGFCAAISCRSGCRFQFTRDGEIAPRMPETDGDEMALACCDASSLHAVAELGPHLRSRKIDHGVAFGRITTERVVPPPGMVTSLPPVGSLPSFPRMG